MKPFQLIDKSSGGSFKNDILSGITVALALVPEAVAFAFVAGVSPIVGLYGAFMMGLITSIFGGRPGMISGATGAMAVVMVHLVQEGNVLGGSESIGLQYLFITLILYFSNVGWYFKTRKICSNDSSSSYDGIRKWFSNSHFYFSIGDV